MTASRMRWRTVSRRAGIVVSGTVLLAGLATGCTSARSSLGTGDSSCFQALPTAVEAVHSQGRLIGTHLFDLSALRHQSPLLAAALSADVVGSKPSHVCVVAFKGNYAAHSVSRPLGQSTGALAVVVIRSPSNALIGTVIFTRSPLHFGHPHVG